MCVELVQCALECALPSHSGTGYAYQGADQWVEQYLNEAEDSF